MNVADLQKLLDGHLSEFVQIVPTYNEGDFVAKRDPVYEGGSGDPVLRVWPSVFKDMGFVITKAEAQADGSIRATTARGDIVIRSARTPGQHS